MFRNVFKSIMFELSRTPAADYQGQRRKEGQTYEKVPSTSGQPVAPLAHPHPNWKKDDDAPDQNEKSLHPAEPSEPAPTSQIPKYCSFCERQILTSVELQPSIWSFLVSFIVFLSFGFIGFCIIPFIWPLLQVSEYVRVFASGGAEKAFFIC